ncbi:MAG: hypothetical protein HRU76_05945 [Phycisphaeraceae bacterium]|nr:MAG: hypothetical protein HRU76_05945 [Phycisphaeraceae bacterium]
MLGAVLLGPIGCGQRAPRSPDAGRPAPLPPDTAAPFTEQDIDTRWPYWPAAMRIHPLTMLTHDRKSNEPVIEARLEFFDSQGHTTKCAARVRWELHRGDPGDGAGEPQKVWPMINLRNVELNTRHYDPVTRTYLFRLVLDAELTDADWRLRALVVSADGRQFMATTRVR